MLHVQKTAFVYLSLGLCAAAPAKTPPAGQEGLTQKGNALEPALNGLSVCTRYSQCGGQNWSGCAGCPAGQVCKKKGEYTSVCEDGEAPTPKPPTPKPTPPTPTNEYTINNPGARRSFETPLRIHVPRLVRPSAARPCLIDS